MGRSTLRRVGFVRRAQTSSVAGLRAPRLRMRYCRVSPESTMSSTIRTWRPSIGVSRSLRIRTTPLESVAEPYDDTAMKSTSHGIEIWRMTSARKKTAPLRTPMRSRSRSAYSWVMAWPSERTRCLRSSGWTRISPIAGSRIGARSLRARDRQRRCALAAQHGSVDDRAGALAEVERAVPEGQDVVQPAGRAGAQSARRVLGQAAHDQPRQRPRQGGQVGDLDPVAPGQRGVDDEVEHLGLVAQQRGGPHDVALGRRVDRAQRGHEAVPYPPARGYALPVGRVLPPRQPAAPAPRGRLLTRDAEQ